MYDSEYATHDSVYATEKSVRGTEKIVYATHETIRGVFTEKTLFTLNALWYIRLRVKVKSYFNKKFL